MRPVNSYSKNSDDRLNTCHPDLIHICRKLLKYFDHSVYEGYRGKEEQNHYLAIGRSKVKYPNGKHNKKPAMAVDIAPYPREKKEKCRIAKYNIMTGHFFQIAAELYEAGVITHKIRWGGDWNMDDNLSNNSWDDLAHFELIPHNE